MNDIERNVQNILRKFNVPDTVKLQATDGGLGPDSFIENLSCYISERKLSGSPVDIACVVLLMHELSSVETAMTALISCLPKCVGSGKAVCSLFYSIRNGITVARAGERVNSAPYIPITYHEDIHKAIAEFVRTTDPPHMALPGDKDSYVQVSAIPLPLSRAFTVSMWVKLSEASHSKGFLLYRYRSAGAGVDAIISASTQDSAPGTWNLTIRSSCDQKGARDEVQCRMSITVGEWHLITVRQSAMKDGADSVSVAVDSASVLEAELLYPFTAAATESIWIFGLGLKGCLTSISLYPFDLQPSLIELLYGFGPHVSHLAVGARCPQSSFDTGHLILGTVCAKGNLAAKLAHLTPIFCITPVKATADARIPLVTPGVLYSDHIDLQPRVPEHDELLLCTLTGGCAVRGLTGGIDVWQDAGGCAVVMYLFWAYCDINCTSAKSAPSSNKSQANFLDDAVDRPPSAASTSKPLNEHAKDGILATLRLLALLIATSTDFKEQFIQCHGFHVIGYCLSIMPDAVKRSLIDEELIDICFDLVQALGHDSERGDGISAAMQGLLFDFRVWGACQLPALSHYLQRLSARLVELGSLVYKCIGVQRILDIFRLHIARKLSTTPTPATGGGAKGSNASGADSAEEHSLEIADSVHRLLIIAMDAAQSFAVRTKTTVAPDAEALLRCLEETNNAVIAERILRLIGSLRLSAPNSLKTALHAVRYNDTAIIPLLNKKGFSMEVRSGALCNLLWMWGEDVRQLPPQIIPARKALNQVLLSQGAGPAGAVARRGSVVAADTIRTKALTDQIADLVKPLERCWVNLSMIGEVVRAAVAEGQWGKIVPSVFVPEATSAVKGSVSGADLLEYVAPVVTVSAAATSTAASAAQSAADVSALIRVIMHSGQLDSWMQVPLLPALLSRCDLNTYCSMLMSMNVMFKTDDNQCEVLSCLPTSAWLKTFLELAIMSEKAAIYCENQIPVKEAATAHSTDSDVTVAATCTELALDCVSIVLEYKTRTQLQENGALWTTFQTVVHNACVLSFGETKLGEEIEMGFLRRIVSLLLHRIANTGEQWVPNLIARTVHIFSMVESRKLFGASDQNTVSSAAALVEEPNLLDCADLVTDSSPNRLPSETEKMRLRNKAIQETNIICFIFDISSSLRKAADRGALQGLEWRAMKIALRITLAALDSASERVADRIMQEILAQLKYMSERWAPITGNGYKSSLMVILTTLKDAIQAPTTPEYLRGRYSALVFGIMHSFIEIRHLVAGGGTISQQLLPALDALMGIDSCNDINLIFKLLDVTMRKADAISFEEVEVQDDSSDSPRSEHVSASESYISLNKEKFTPDDDKLVKLPAEESGGDYSDLPLEGGMVEPSPEPSMPVTDDATPVVGTAGGSERSSPKVVEGGSRGRSPMPGAAVATRPQQSAQHFSSYTALSEATHKEAHFKQWLSVRQGISTERVDSERARLSRSMDTLDLTSMATKKFWKKARRKVESESFLQTHACQWKLGVAHEGPFYGRRRVVLRPRFDSHYGQVSDHSKADGDADDAQAAVKEVATPGGDQLSRALATACAGYIKDVTRSEAVDASVMEKDGAAKGMPPTHAPGSGWGLVDVDGSEEGGFGVVGIAVAETSPPTEDSSSTGNGENAGLAQLPDDMQGDVRQLEENFKQGKGTETGPCHSGTRRVGSGPPLLEAGVILITASGNFGGTLSFNGKEIFFASTFEAEDRRTDDNAAVNLVKQRRMRRRRWVVSYVWQSSIYYVFNPYLLGNCTPPVLMRCSCRTAFVRGGYLHASLPFARLRHGGVLQEGQAPQLLRRLRPHQGGRQTAQ
jgi:hypothetical protein